MSINENKSDKVNTNSITKISLSKRQKIPLYIMTVNIEKDIQKELPIFQDSNPGDLAFEFCKLNNLDYSSLETIKNNIEKAITSENMESPINFEEDDMTKVKQITDSNQLQSEEDFPITFKKENKHDTNQRESKRNLIINNSSTMGNSKQKLFPYDIKISKNKNYKSKTKITKRSLSQEKNKNNNNKNNNNRNLTTESSKKSFETNNKKLLTNGWNLSRVSSQLNLKRNIFERLFKDSELKRITYRRPCHFSNNNNRKVNEMNRGVSQNNSINTLSLFSGYDGRIETDYSKSYMLKPNYNKGHRCTFKPNITPLQPPLGFQMSKQFSSSLNSIHKNENNTISARTLYRPKIVSNKTKVRNFYPFYKTEENPKEATTAKDVKLIDGSSEKFNEMRSQTVISNSNNSLDGQKIAYVPLKNKMRQIKTQEGDLCLDKIRCDAFNNLFEQLKGDQEITLSKNNLTLDGIPQVIQNDLAPVFEIVNKNNVAFSKEEFIGLMKEMFNTMSMESKRNIISQYKNSKNTKHRVVNCFNTMRNKPQTFFFNSSTFTHSSKKSRSKNKVVKGIFNKTTTPQGKRNFYYLFGS